MVKLEEALELIVLGVSGRTHPGRGPAPSRGHLPMLSPIALLQSHWPSSLVFAMPYKAWGLVFSFDNIWQQWEKRLPKWVPLVA